MPGEGFLLGLLLAGLFLLASDLGFHAPGGGDEEGRGGWVRLVDADGGMRFCRVVEGEPLHTFLDRELPDSNVPEETSRSTIRVGSGMEIRIVNDSEDTVHGGSFRVVPLQERFRYLLGLPLNLNRAREEELALLPGIGEILARRIRQAGDAQEGFSSWDDLHRVPGLGMKRLKKIERHATVGP